MVAQKRNAKITNKQLTNINTNIYIKVALFQKTTFRNIFFAACLQKTASVRNSMLLGV